MLRNNIAFLVLLATLSLSISCAKPYVGQSISYNHPLVCYLDNIGEYSVKQKHFVFTFTIEGGSEPGMYVLNGIAVWKGNKVYTELDRPDFALLLIKQGVIVDYISFAPLSYDLTTAMPFRKDFSCPGGLFDAVTIVYHIRVRG